MNLAAFDAFCLALPGSTRVVQWGDSHVFKVGDKIFALGNGQSETYFIFKTTPLSFQILLEQGIAVRAPYLPRGGWVKVMAGRMPAKDLRDYIAQSHRMIAAALPKPVRERLGV
jgi:predicted DNA-binding protein (MmcQ/YjbR family)